MNKEISTWKEGEEIKWKDLCMVRSVVDVEKQLKVEKGQLISMSPINSSKGELPRLTVHWALNHIVKDHLWSSWSGGKLIILSPGDKLVEENGVPENLNAVDTFWAKDMIIPEGSKLLWIGVETPEEFFELSGIENKSCEISGGYRESLIKSLGDHARIKKDWEDKKEGVNFDDVQKAESQTYYWGGLVKNEMDKIVNEELELMGYKVFEGDHGTYMDGPMADSIYDLAEVEKISSATHVETLLGGIEMGAFLQPLMQIARETDEEMFKVRKDGETDFLKVLREVGNQLKEHEVDKRGLKEAEQRQLLVLATELYNRVRNNEEFLDKRDLLALRSFLDSSELVRRNWSSWDIDLVKYIYDRRE